MDKKIEGNIYLVAAYLANGARIHKVNRDNERHIKFTVSGEDLHEIELAWLNEELTGNLFDYHRAIRKVKNILYAR